MQDDQFFSFNELKLVRLFVTVFGGSCGICISPNNSFVKEESCSFGTPDVFFDWQFSGSQYNSYHVFGIQDTNNSSQYRFIDMEQDKYLRLSSISLPLNKDLLLNSTDSRLFLMEQITQRDVWSLRHVASKKYISVNSNNDQIILVNSEESALEVKIVNQ